MMCGWSSPDFDKRLKIKGLFFPLFWASLLIVRDQEFGDRFMRRMAVPCGVNGFLPGDPEAFEDPLDPRMIVN
jgi:hypothetical protein